MLIVVEGFDGCGKTTVANAIGAALKCKVIHFPKDDAVTGPVIRAYLKREWHAASPDPWDRGDGFSKDEKLGALALQALMIANRMEVMSELRKAEGYGATNLVLARYSPSAWVYGQLDGLDRDFIDRTHETMAHADLSLLLDVEPEECLRRRAARDGSAIAPERYEGKLDLATRAIELYRELWRRQNDADSEHHDGTDWRLIPAMGPITEVWAAALEAVRCHIT